MSFEYLKSFIEITDDIYFKTDNENNNIIGFKGNYEYKIKIDKQNKIIPLIETFIDIHYYRLIKLKFGNFLNNNNFINFIDYSRNRTKDICDYCTICGDKLNIITGNVYWCEKEMCTYEEECSLTENTIKNKLNKNLISSKLIVSCCLHNINTNIIRLSPFPLMFVSDKKSYTRKLINEKDKLVIQPDKDRINLKTFYNSNSEILNNIIDEMLKFLDDYKNDIDLYHKFGESIYGLIKYMLKIINYNIVILDNEYISQKYNLSYINNKNISLYEIKYPERKEKEFKDSKLYYHGSPYGNWFSIIRNGIKNMSDSRFMTSGKALGPGIYLADNINIAIRYTSTNNSNDIINKNKYLIGVFKIKNTEKYIKPSNGGILTVNNESDVILKYIISINKSYSSNYNIIYNYLNNYNSNQIKMIDEFFHLINKRIDKEILRVNKYYNEDEIIINKLSNYIELVFVKYNITFLIYITYFYPCDPPLIKIKNKYSIIGNVPINNDGYVLCKTVHPHTWNFKNTFLKIIEDIKSFIKNIKNNS